MPPRMLFAETFYWVALLNPGDAYHARVAEEQARKAKEQAEAFNSLADGLGRLAKGDLSFQLSSGFTDEYKQIRDDLSSRNSTGVAIGR